MRRDAVGFFWNDAPIPKPPRPETPKRQPPERVWERPDYLPGLEQALKFPVDQFDDHSLMSEAGGELYYDIECYMNYFQVAFMSKRSGKVIDFEYSADMDWYCDLQRLHWITQHFTLKGFNSWSYDLPMLSYMLAGATNEQLKWMSDQIIVYGVNASELLKQLKVKRLKCDHVDLIEVAPLFAGLKTYGGRIHVPRMQDLPVNPNAILTEKQMAIVRWYCVNDLIQTGCLDHTLSEEQKLRMVLSSEIGVDLRSKSDAQIAEAVIAEELFRRTRSRARRGPEISPGTVYRYSVPSYMQFQTPYMRQVLDIVRDCMFIVDHTGNIPKPAELNGLNVSIGNLSYTMGIGGLHSTEKSTCHRAVGGYRIFDVDVESYYPRIILNQRIYPQHLGEAFLNVFESIVERRVRAKRAGDKTIANSLKITINGTFGKLGNQYSLFYAPDLLVQVTISGQLNLLMLIELLEMYGCEVISANTDGIAIKVHDSKVEVMRQVVKHWEQVTGFKTEENEYVLLACKDVNNYIAVKKDCSIKGKGLYANPWHKDAKDPVDRLKKNPAGTICVDAVQEFLATGKPINHTIYESNDFTKFLAVRQVTGGAVCNGIYLGKSVRWYHSTEPQAEMVSAKSGNKVPKTDGAKPCMELPLTFPSDVDREWYVREAEEILKLIGYYG